MIRWLKTGWFRAMMMLWTAPFILTALISEVFGAMAAACLERILKFESLRFDEASEVDEVDPDYDPDLDEWA
jgi:hypothetical protein